MNLKWNVIAASLSLFATFITCDIVEIEDGKIEGTKLKSRLGEEYDAFLNIPYAEAPIKELRFQPPVAVKPWTGILNATVFGPFCMQKLMPMNSPDTPVSENCLQLNVFTKNLPIAGNSANLKPVIVYIHGGAWMGGSGVDSNAVLIMDRDIVFVTINYRLGAFGFLATGTKDAYGNMAQKDQVLALKWVQKNIEKFGGDQNRVTIAGLSAGAHSVTALVVSPMGKGLFHGAIAQSGGITWQAKFETEYLKTAKKLAEKLDCKTDDVTAMVECLKQIPGEEIVNVELNDWPDCPVLVWIPVVEPDLGQERVFTEQPVETVQSGNFSKVPIIIGITADEWMSPIPKILSNSDLMRQFNENFDEVAPICFSYERGTDLSKALSKKFREFYFPLDTIDARSFSGFNFLLSEGIIGYGAHKFVHLASNFTDVFYYKFTYMGQYGAFKYPGNKPYGVHHGDDGLYVVPADFSNVIQPEEPENLMVERMTRIFEQFASTGNPNNSTDEYLKEMNWPKHTVESEYFLDIGTHLVEKKGLYLERYSIWDKTVSAGRTLKLEKVLLVTVIAVIAIFK